MLTRTFYYGINRVASELSLSEYQVNQLVECGLLPVAAFAEIGDKTLQLFDPSILDEADWSEAFDAALLEADLLAEEDDDDDDDDAFFFAPAENIKYVGVLS